MKIKSTFLSVFLSMTTVTFSSYADSLGDKTALEMGEQVTLSAPSASGVTSLRWILPKGYVLNGLPTDQTLVATATYYAQSGDVKLIRNFESGTVDTLTQKLDLVRPISKIVDHKINEGDSILIDGVYQKKADIYYEATGANELTAHRLTVMSLGNARVMKPYLQSVSDSAIFISWKASLLDVGAKIVYGTTPDQLNQELTSTVEKLSDNYYWYTADLRGLESSTLYYYKVVSPEAYSETAGESELFRFKTAPKAGAKTKSRVLFMGDHQLSTRSGYEWLMQAAKRKVEEKYGQSVEEAIDVILNVGDQVDVGTLAQYEQIHLYKSDIMSPNISIMTAVGNHETYSDGNLAKYFSHYHYDGLAYKGIKSGTERYYAYQLGRTLYVYLDTELNGDTQKAWVQKVVNAAKNDDDVDFIISVQHRPVQAEQYIGDISPWTRNEIMPILSQTPKHVLNYGGHHHLYHRGQFANFPLYHIINGAASWDQMWGMSSEEDYDDVQKTVDYWVYNIVEFDYETKKMSVETYAIGNKMLVTDNILIDTFERQFDLPAPAKPELQEIPETANLPLTLKGDNYQTASGLKHNTTQFQISTSNDFTTLAVNKIMDFENLYGSTKDPLYLPVDLNEGIDLTTYTIAENSIKNGDYYVRVRYRDTNMEWSEWSDAKSFKVEGSIVSEPAISVAKTVYALGEDVVVDYEYAPVGKNAWIGVYKKGEKPSGPVSTIWKYTPEAAGKLNLGKLNSVNEYFIAFFGDSGYNEIAPRIPIYAGPVPVLTSEKNAYKEGEKVSISFSNSPCLANDWIGIYKMGMTPGPIPSYDWEYVSGFIASDSTINFKKTLDKGYYYATYMLKGDYFEPGERTYFSIGEQISLVSADIYDYEPGDTIRIHYADGPGTPKDWLGVFEQSKVVGEDELDAFYYTYGETKGTIVIPPTDLPAGEYFVSLYINDSYDEVSNRINLSIGKAPELSAKESDDAILVEFEDKRNWREAITEIRVNGVLVESSDYTIASGVIALDKKYFDTQLSEILILSKDWMKAQVIYDRTMTGITTHQTSVVVYPSLVSEFVMVNNENALYSQLQVKNMNGLTLKESRLLEGINQVDLHTLLPGSYMIILNGTSGTRAEVIIKR